jgi:hypothetical protein
MKYWPVIFTKYLIFFFIGLFVAVSTWVNIDYFRVLHYEAQTREFYEELEKDLGNCRPTEFYTYNKYFEALVPVFHCDKTPSAEKFPEKLPKLK